jgi:hypothetical protein
MHSDLIGATEKDLLDRAAMVLDERYVVCIRLQAIAGDHETLGLGIAPELG